MQEMWWFSTLPPRKPQTFFLVEAPPSSRDCFSVSRIRAVRWLNWSSEHDKKDLVLAPSSFAGLSDAATVKGRIREGTLKGLASDRGNSLGYPPWLRRESIRGFCWLQLLWTQGRKELLSLFTYLLTTKTKIPRADTGILIERDKTEKLIINEMCKFKYNLKPQWSFAFYQNWTL